MLDPIQLAHKHYYYISHYQIAADVICSDPIRRDQARAAVDSVAGPGTPGVAPLFGPTRTVRDDEVDGILEQYDRVLAIEAKSYDDFLHRLQYAFAAGIFFYSHKVTPALRHDEELFNMYDTEMGKLSQILHEVQPTSGLVDRP
ncbi:uncharacterized protein PHACADRAFT_180887 [Phanerochaete carnosa HHB-10118-sp]|uniref:Uncharacterized protein n=1 Tax=Phanerochaete carnosa (strain HHB-10118-sp) TaxID=650164 RepID=K5XFL5_PHACS|nr:uncharacterized protein PHACADRAFT_180887 [Phanerochaete carnosa HHB-10118-sp]EKM61867.1 hypothetical protein PHACADRAFT_180887 [Phanerochaete carnosa HHB-10118-sp]